MMPHTRREVFFDVLRLQYKSLLSIGACLLLAALPLLLCYVEEQVYTSMMLDEAGELAAGTAQYLSVRSRIAVFSEAMAFIKILPICIFAAVLSGAMRMIRQYAYEECVSFSTDFTLGFKQNFRQTVLLAAVFQLLFALSYLAYGLRGETEGFMSAVAAVPLCLFAIFFVPVAMIMTVVISVYDYGFGKGFSVSVYVFMREPLRIIAACACAALPFALSLVPTFLTGVLGRALGILVMPFSMLGFYLFLYNVLDRHVNAREYPEIVGRGTF